MSAKNSPPAFVSPIEAAAHLGVNPRTIRRRIAEGSLPAYRMPGSSRGIRIKFADLEASLKPIPAGTVRAGGDAS